MTKVCLELEDKHGETQPCEVECDLTLQDLKVLRQYSAMTDRVRSSTLLQRGMPGFEGLEFNNAGFVLTSGNCSDPELHELPHVLRPVTLERERASFQKTSSILWHRLRWPLVQKFLEINAHVFLHGQMSLFFQVTVGERPLFAESLLRTWLNGTQYHTDASKEADWAALQASLGEASARSVVISQLHGKIVSVLNIDYIVKTTLAAYPEDA